MIGGFQSYGIPVRIPLSISVTVACDGITDLASEDAMWSAASALFNSCVSRGKLGIRRGLGKSRILCSAWHGTIANANDDRPGPSSYHSNLSFELKRGEEAVLFKMLQHCVELPRRRQIANTIWLT